MSNNNTPHAKYDVFVSFIRGEDIRHDFLSHLVKAFPRKQINAFVDVKLGDDISHSLLEAIEGSSISLVIFSENYVTSRWCLAELAKIIERKENYEQIVIPVFYGVDPKDVRHQTKSYENAFSEFEKRYNLSEVQTWRRALEISANLSGIRSSSFRNDADLIEEIINNVSMRLSKPPINSKGLVGIDKSISHLKSLLQKESKKARVIGIWGMGGIGKTTISEEIFKQIYSEYQGYCFLAKVSEEIGKHGITSIKEKLFSKLLVEDVKIDSPNGLSDYIRRRIGHMKVLIVLDDVKETNQLEMLFGTLDWFPSNSRIIVTSRDRQVLIANEVDEDDLYEVGELDSSEALELFNLNAFKKSHLETEFYDVSKTMVHYAKGVPLVLKVLANMLRGKEEKEVWESQLDKLKRMPIKEVHGIMRLSYDDLDRLEQKYFLDIACFFNGLSLKVDYMKYLLKDYESDNSVAVGLERLKDKALITISEDNVVSMHDILQEMGREVVRQESSEDPRKRNRLWDPDFIHDVLKNDKLKGVAENAMSNNTPHAKYDVFVSFRGEDIRRHFLSHLTKAFPGKQINAFVDDKLKRGGDISHLLVEAIEGSSISLVIFSEDYATSRWCLAEVAKIIECKEKYEQIVIPVFYGVDPRDVRYQKRTYENAFAKHEKRYNSSQVQIWRDALKISANLSGIVSSSFPDDAKLLEEIIKQVLMSLRKHSVSSKGLIGINKPIAHLKSLLQKESKELRVIGIWGMGGIGKTTIADEIFNQIYSEYDGCCLLKNVNEKLTRHGMESIEEKLFSTLLNEPVKELSNDVKRRIGQMKVLIVLDDVKGRDQLEKLFGTRDWFRSDSRIIVTGRDKQLLIDNEVDEDDLYEVGVLDSSEALALFNMNAFKQSDLEVDQFCDLAKRVIDYAKGNPLVLKVLAHMLRGKKKEVWESQLDKLKRLPVQEVDKVMRLSYDDLDPLEKKYFLDIACFFNGLSLKVDYMKLLLRDSDSDNSVAAGLESLKDKALITISKDNVISMHDILQEMGREVVRQESREHPEKRSRLWNPDEIYDVLKNDKGTNAIRSISLPTMRELKLSRHVFDKMTNLRFLYFLGMDGFDCLPQGLQSFPLGIKYLHWTYCPLKSFPENFSSENLVILDLSYSLFEKLWCGVQNLVNLKEVKLCWSKLKELPDFSKAPNLVHLDLSQCYSLRSCGKLSELSVTLENIVELDLSCCPINALPSSFGCQSNLEILVLSLTEIESIPSSIKNLTRLRKLDIQFCSKLMALPELPSSVETLLVECESLKTVLFPSTVAEQLKENKKRIEFWNCLNLDESSLINIGFNMKINLMKFAANFGSDQAVYVYPGSSVPDWFEYKTTTDDMIVDISPHHRSPLLGFVFCFVFKNKTSSSFQIYTHMEFNISVEGDGEKDGVDIYMRSSIVKSDHVSMVYDQQCSQFLTKKAKNQARFKIKVTVRVFAFSSYVFDHVELKGFGMSPINQSTYHNLIQKYGKLTFMQSLVC